MIFLTATPKLWVVSFTVFSLRPLYKAKSWKTQNTDFGYKKWLKFESDRIFWSATPTLWVLSFVTFGSKSFLTKGKNPLFCRTFRRIILGMPCLFQLTIIWKRYSLSWCSIFEINPLFDITNLWLFFGCWPTIILEIAEPREKRCCRIRNTSFSAKICWSNVAKYLYFSLKKLKHP